MVIKVYANGLVYELEQFLQFPNFDYNTILDRLRKIFNHGMSSTTVYLLE